MASIRKDWKVLDTIRRKNSASMQVHINFTVINAEELYV